MLAVTKRPIQNTEKENNPNNDIIVNKIEYESQYEDDGTEIRKRKIKQVNLSRKINETAKLVKNYTAEEKLAELEKVFSK